MVEHILVQKVRLVEQKHWMHTLTTKLFDV